MRGGPEVFQQLWPEPPPVWTLADDEVHVWSALLDQPASIATVVTATLSRDERNRAARFRFEQERERFSVGRGMLRQILGSYLQTEPTDLLFHYGPHGKPAVAMHATPLSFNVSHSGKLLLVAVTRQRPVGVDVERICWLAEADRIAQRFFSPDEKVQVRRAGPEQKLRIFFSIWTRKEAVLKCSGKGLGEFEEMGGLRFAGVVKELAPACGYVGAIALQNPTVTLKTWQWPVLDQITTDR